MTHVPSPARVGALAVMAAGVLWGTTGTAQALSPYPGSAHGLGAARILLAGLVLTCFCVAGSGLASLRQLWRPQARRLVAVGAVAMAAYQVCFFTATARTGVAVGTLTAIGSAPLLAGVLAVTTGGVVTRRWLAATAVALAGLCLLVMPAGDAHLRPWGVAAGLGAGGGYAVYTWCSRRLLDAGVPALPLLTGLFLGGAVLVLPLGWQDTVGWLTDGSGLAVAGYLALVATVLPYLIWIRGMATTAPAVATTLTLTEPLTAATLGVLVLHEPLTVPLLAGAVLIAVGLVLAVTGASVGDRAEQRGDLAVVQPAGASGAQVAEPDGPDGRTDQP